MSEWVSVNVRKPCIGQYVQLYSNGVVQNINAMFDEGDDGEFWHSHGLLDDDPRIQDRDMWMPLPELPSNT